MTNKPKPEVCVKCNGNGWYQYTTTGTPHSKPCEVCCKHTGEQWKHEDGKYYCRAGCGAEMPSPASTEEWIERYGKAWEDTFTDPYKQSVEFIKELLASHDQQLRQRIVEAGEKMREDLWKKLLNHPMSGCDEECHDKPHHYKMVAISEFLTFITNLK